MSETNETKTARKSIVIRLGIVCIILVACLGGVIASYTFILNDKNNTITSLRSQISELNSNVTNLQEQLNSILNVTTSLVENDPSALVNKTVVLKGRMDGPIMMPGDMRLPYSYELNSDGQTIRLSFSASVNLTSFYSNQYVDAATINITNHSVGSIRVYFLNSSLVVVVYGVVKEGETIYAVWPPQVTYYIEVEKVEIF
jgi:hypothetical protein